MMKRNNGILLLLLGLILLTSAGCDFFRDPDAGFDDDWTPDGVEAPITEEPEAPVINSPDPVTGDDVPDNSDIEGHKVSDRRPSEILADTMSLRSKSGTWEKEGEERSDFSLYLGPDGKTPEMIVEETEESTRNYFFNDGLLFYYTEESHDGSFDLTVEFDDLGDVRGAQKLRNGKRVRADSDDYSEIVKRAMELQRTETPPTVEE